jgi:hypothetical protein
VKYGSLNFLELRVSADLYRYCLTFKESTVLTKHYFDKIKNGNGIYNALYYGDEASKKSSLSLFCIATLTIDSMKCGT